MSTADIIKRAGSQDADGYDEKKLQIFYNNMENTLHDIKAPVSVIFSALQAICSEMSDTPEMARLIDVSLKNCVDIMKMIQELNDTERIISGRIQPRLYNCDIVAISESVVLSMNTVAARKQVEIIFDTTTEEKAMAIDQSLFERMLYNILLNAIKYTPDGSVINVCLFDYGNHIAVEVADQGGGISGDVLPFIFDRHITSEKGLNTVNSGIGLFIVYEIASLLNGRVYVKESDFEGGTVMCVELPVYTADEKEAVRSAGFDLFYSNMAQTAITDLIKLARE